MKYWIQLSARMNSAYSVPDKHRDIIEKLQEIKNDWGIKPDVTTNPPSFGTNPTAIYSFYRKFNSKSVKGIIIYSYREDDNDRHSQDDFCTIEFDDRKVDIDVLLNDVIYRYIDIFDAYSMNIFPEDLVHQLAEIPMEIRSKINYRNTIKYFSPVSFYDEQLIKRALSIEPLQFYNILEGKVDSVEIVKGGVLLKAKKQLLDLEASNEYNEMMKMILNITLPVGEPFR